MKKNPLLVTIVATLPFIIPLQASAAKSTGPKARMMEKYDLNQNGVIEGDEIIAVRKDFAAAPTGDLQRYDANKNGKLEDAEIAAIKGPSAGKDGEKSDKGKKKEKARKTAAPAETTESKE